jgi:hypothetical protein
MGHHLSMETRRFMLIASGLAVVAAAVLLIVFGQGDPAEEGSSPPGGSSAAARSDAEEPRVGPTPDARDEVVVGSEVAMAGDPKRERVRGEPMSGGASRTYEVSGRVVDSSGQPLAGVAVVAFRPGFRGIGGTVVGQTQTDAGGGYILRVPRNMPLKIEAHSDGFQAKRIDVREHGGSGHDVRLEAR